MKELNKRTFILSGIEGLTNLPQTPYSKGGDIFMEGKPNMPANSQPTNPEHAEKAPQAPKLGVEKPVSAERQATARKAWKDLYAGENLPFEMRQTIEGAIRMGAVPVGGAQQDLPQERERQELEDKKAAALIAKFVQGGGWENREKAEQLGRDLSERIHELMEEQSALGASEGATTSEGTLTASAAAAIDELNSRINQIQSFLAEGFQERTRRQDPVANRLIRESREFVSGLLGRGLRLDQINDLTESTKLTTGERATRARLVHEIKGFIERSPSLETSDFDSDILLAVRHFRELREQLISDIMFKSFEDRSETNEYEVNLYADSNLNTLLGFMNKDDNERYKYFFSLRTATRFFQSMNATVLKGTFDSFGHAAENINYQHFENMRDIRGSGLAMRLYEQAYKDVLASDKSVTQDKIAGIKEFVEATFKEINEAGLIKSEYAQYRTDSKMENWEVQRALAAGRSFLNITLRAAENIATGQVPFDRKRFTSPPQEDMVRILNWNHWLLERFVVGGDKAGRHGEEFLKLSTDKWQEFLRYKGAKLDKNQIVEFGGVNVRKMEEGGQYRTSGVYSGWRLENMAFDEIYFNYEGNRLSVQKFRDMRTEDKKGVKDVVDAIKKRIEDRKTKNPNIDPKDQVTKADQEEYRNVLMPVVNNLNYGLSMLLKNGDFGAHDNKLGYLLRTEIWKKIANTNIPLMIDYLNEVQYEWSKLGEIDKKLADLGLKKDKSKEDRLEMWRLGEEKSKLEKIKVEAENAGLQEAKSLKQLRKEFVKDWTEKKWKDFGKNALIRYERTVREGMLEVGEKLEPLDPQYELDADERKLEDAIRKEGAKLAPHLADIVFAYTPFMNDMPFEKFQYKYAGQTFYKRRTTGDLGGFNKGQQAYAKILSNPGGIPVKDAVAAMGEIIAGVEIPEGPRAAIESNFPTFSVLLDVVTTAPWKRQAMFKMLLEATRKETSTAQRWQGIRADSFVESEAANLIDETTRAGILTPELARYLKKEKHLTLSAILWMLFRDIFVMVPIFAGAEFIGKLTKEK